MRRTLLVIAAVAAVAGHARYASAQWTVTATPAGGRTVAVNMSGVWGEGCVPHDPHATVSGSHVDITLQASVPPDGCTCLADPSSFQGTVLIEPLVAGTNSVTVTVLSCSAPQQVGSTTFNFDAALADTLYLDDNRFTVTAAFQQTPEGPSAPATAVPLTDDTGYFWFFDPANIEVVVKVLTGCSVNGKYWVFAGGLTNVGVELKVTDTRTGASQSYLNAVGTPFQPIQDSSAFPCP